MAIPVWRSSTERVRLPQDEVHVWQATTRLALPEILHMRNWLAADEEERAQRFYFEHDRQRFIIARAGLRKLLGLYLNVAPESLRFQYNEYGKPALAMPELPLASHLCFNMSHSREVILYAFVLDRAVGVDVEYMRENIEIADLARTCFSSVEQQALQKLPARLQLEGFYNCWSRKEAYIKARGRGLSLPLGLFDVTLVPGQPAELIGSREGPQEVTRWRMHALTPAPDYAGALAVEGHEWKLKYFLVENPVELSIQEEEQ
jgi:4'-phosphopantetheinyl transferase